MAILRNGKKVTAKQWAIYMWLSDLEMITEYFYERHASDLDQMSEKEIEKVEDQVRKIDQRFRTMLLKAYKI